jgi:hypothetical protein
MTRSNTRSPEDQKTERKRTPKTPALTHLPTPISTHTANLGRLRKLSFKDKIKADPELLPDRITPPLEQDESSNPTGDKIRERWQKWVHYTGTDEDFILNIQHMKAEMPEKYKNLSLTSPPVTLTNEIHTLFQKEQWPMEDFATETKLWKNLEPMFRLATRILQSEQVLSVLRKIKSGTEKQDRKAGKPAKTYLDYTQPTTKRQREEENAVILNELEKISQHLSFLFGAFNLPFEKVEAQCHAVHTVILSELNEEYYLDGRGNTDFLPSDGSMHYIIMNDAYRQYFSQPDNARSDYADLRTTFAGAATLVHELSHEYYARNFTDNSEDFEEPFFSIVQARCGQEGHEIGIALEHAIWGADINLVTHPTHGTDMEVRRLDILWNAAGTEVVQLERPAFLVYPVEPAWLSSLCTDAFWDKVGGYTAKKQIETALFTKIAAHAVGRKDTGDQFQWTANRASKKQLSLYLVKHTTQLMLEEFLEDEEKKSAAIEKEQKQRRKDEKGKKDKKSRSGGIVKTRKTTNSPKVSRFQK